MKKRIPALTYFLMGGVIAANLVMGPTPVDAQTLTKAEALTAANADACAASTSALAFRPRPRRSKMRSALPSGFLPAAPANDPSPSCRGVRGWSGVRTGHLDGERMAHGG